MSNQIKKMKTIDSVNQHLKELKEFGDKIDLNKLRM